MGRNTADAGLAGRVTTTGLAEPWPLSENCSRQGKLSGPDSGRVQSGSQPSVPNMARASFRGRCCLPPLIWAPPREEREAKNI